MGFIKRKTKSPERPPTPAKLQGVPSEDLYLMVETSLMSAQQYLSQYRSAPMADKGPLLAWLDESVRTANVCTAELARRL